MSNVRDVTRNTRPAGYRVPQAARRLDVCEKTIYRLIARGELKAWKSGRGYLISEEAIQAYLNRDQGTRDA